jgi:hypothetical protein
MCKRFVKQVRGGESHFQKQKTRLANLGKFSTALEMLLSAGTCYNSLSPNGTPFSTALTAPIFELLHFVERASTLFTLMRRGKSMESSQAPSILT